MTTLTRYAILGASQTAADATSGILHADAAHAATVARAMTRRAAEPFFHTDTLLKGPYRVCRLEVTVHDDAADTAPVSST